MFVCVKGESFRLSTKDIPALLITLSSKDIPALQQGIKASCILKASCIFERIAVDTEGRSGSERGSRHARYRL